MVTTTGKTYETSKRKVVIDLDKLCQDIGLDYSGENIQISAMNTLKDASERELSFVANTKYINDIKKTRAGVVILSAENAQHLPSSSIALVCDEPYLMMAKASKYFAPPLQNPSAPEPIIGKNCDISAKATIENGATIGDKCTIMAGAYVGTNVKIGDNVILHPNTTIYRDCVVGNDCMIHAGTIIGSDGFGFATTKLGTHVKIYQNGNVVLEEDVEIGSNVTIDCAAFGSTLIKRGVRIDNLVQIGHNSVIGEYSVIVAQVGISGSSTLGRNVVMGGQSATSGHLEIAPFTTFAARSGITHSIKESNKTFGGFPLMEQRSWLKLQAKLARLIK